MATVKIILLGGFLGSGKTTAIQQAASLLRTQGIKSGIITNDQGNRLVDSAFIQHAGLHQKEVAGGCFCCRFDELEQVLTRLTEEAKPEIIFAEAVGSCVDLVATVLHPLARFHPGKYETVLSVFADARLLLQFLIGRRGPFHEQVNYIYQKQLEEADIISVNKFDLLKEDEKDQAKAILQAAFPDKILLFQNSLDAADINRWLETALQQQPAGLKWAPDIDYDMYGRGEAQLGWLDTELGVASNDGTAGKSAACLLRQISGKIMGSQFPIGHLKAFVDDGQCQWKLSVTSGSADWDLMDLTRSQSDRFIILLNARVQALPDELSSIVEEAVLETEKVTGGKIINLGLQAFTPAFPKPQHRIP